MKHLFDGIFEEIKSLIESGRKKTYTFLKAPNQPADGLRESRAKSSRPAKALAKNGGGKIE
jgi:hypothetical protein